MTKAGGFEVKACEFGQAATCFFDIFHCGSKLQSAPIDTTISNKQNPAIPFPQKRKLAGGMSWDVDSDQVMIEGQALPIGNQLINLRSFYGLSHQVQYLRHDPIPQPWRRGSISKT